MQIFLGESLRKVSYRLRAAQLHGQIVNKFHFSCVIFVSLVGGLSFVPCLRLCFRQCLPATRPTETWKSWKRTMLTCIGWSMPISRAIEQSETPGTKFCRMRIRNLRVQHGQGKEALYFRWTCLCAGEISGAGLCPERPVHPHGWSADRKPALGHLTQFKNSPAAQQKRTSIQKNRCPF